MMKEQRFDIWVADLPRRGMELKAGRRPVVIVSNEEVCTELPFLTVVPLTKNLTTRQLPSHVLLCSRYLEHPSRALCEQVTTLDRSCLRRRIGHVEDPYDRFALNRALAVQLKLTLTPYLTEDSIYSCIGAE